MAEAQIVINGVRLNMAQSMTLRVAVDAFSQEMAVIGPGKDAQGSKTADSYRQRADEVLALIKASS